jgi:hypothetical protein
MIRQALVTTLALTLTLGGNVLAGDIYKWVDAEGNVHYEDRPLTDGAERVAIESRATDRAVASARASATAESWAERRAARREDRADRPSPEALRAEAEEKQRLCADSRERLQKMLTSHRLYKDDGSGERVYLDAAQIDEARATAQSQVEEHCNS